uniref:Uncharacterized protein n=1 Tax=Glossina pallidipes TaxID=7398 RepID=A0A1A9ZY62_GLOPL
MKRREALDKKAQRHVAIEDQQSYVTNEADKGRTKPNNPIMKFRSNRVIRKEILKSFLPTKTSEISQGSGVKRNIVSRSLIECNKSSVERSHNNCHCTVSLRLLIDERIARFVRRVLAFDAILPIAYCGFAPDAALFHGGLMLLLLLATVTAFALDLPVVRKLRYFCVRSNVERGTETLLADGDCRPPSEFLSPSLCKRVRVPVTVVVVFRLNTGEALEGSKQTPSNNTSCRRAQSSTYPPTPDDIS